MESNKKISELLPLDDAHVDDFYVPGYIDREDIPVQSKTRKTNLSKSIAGKLNQSVVSDVSISPASNKQQLVKTLINLATRQTSTIAADIPECNGIANGLQSAANYQQIQTNTADIENLKGVGRVSAHLGTSPTQQQLTDVWTSVKSDTPTDGATVVNLDQDAPQGHSWTYLATAPDTYEWIDRGIDTVNIATNTAPGIVKGRANTAGNEGYVSVTETGEVWVNGWDKVFPYILFMTSAQAVTSLANIPLSGNVTASISSNNTLSFANLAGMSIGYITRIRVTNTGSSTITITLPVAAPIENDYGPSTQVGAGEKIEFELWCYAPGKYRLKKYNMMYIMNVNPVFTGFDKDGN
ncbi:MAG: hypothetical protein LBL79_01235 [Prevotella sp.]|jgi:hypothetical protein|nr:hypothetical protein [Prevotella sp.]